MPQRPRAGFVGRAEHLNAKAHFGKRRRTGDRFLRPDGERNQRRLEDQVFGSRLGRDRRKQLAVGQMPLEHLGEHRGDRAFPEVVVAVADREAALVQGQHGAAALVLQRRHEHVAIAGCLGPERHVDEEQLVVRKVGGVIQRAAGGGRKSHKAEGEGPERGHLGDAGHDVDAIGRMAPAAQAACAFAYPQPNG